MNLVFKSYPFEYLLGILCYFGFLSCVLVCIFILCDLMMFHLVSCYCSSLHLFVFIFLNMQI